MRLSRKARSSCGAHCSATTVRPLWAALALAPVGWTWAGCWVRCWVGAARALPAVWAGLAAWAAWGGLGGLGGGAAPAAQSSGAAILGHIFGGQQQRAEAGLGQATGLGPKAGSLLQMLAPLVMAFLAQRVQAGQMDPGNLGQVLGQEQAQLRQQGGIGGGLLGSLLDQDGDGQVGMSDLLKIGGSLLGGRR